MTISESLMGDPNEREVVAPFYKTSDESDIVSQLARLLNGLFAVHEAQRMDRNFRGQTIAAVIFKGKLLGEAEALYPQITKRFQGAGFTPLMERRGKSDILLALQGTITAAQVNTRRWVHALLLFLTIITTTLSGAQFQNISLNAISREVQRGNLGYLWQAFVAGAPFAFTLLLILGVHEMGHYLAARRHGVAVTLPYFIPFPLIGILGTLGAVIFIKSPLTNRKALFDVGISGPLAGFVVALIAFVIGLFLTPSSRPNMAFVSLFGSERLGMPILLQVLGDVLRPDVTNLARFVSRQPVALAAWFGMLLTVLNLLPIGQLDGGHVMYTLFGKVAWQIAMITFFAMIMLGLTVFPSLLFFALLAAMTGLRHPPPGNDITELNRTRKIIGYGTIVLFFLIGTLTPFSIGF